MFTWTTHTVDGHDGWTTTRIYRTVERRDAAIRETISELLNDSDYRDDEVNPYVERKTEFGDRWEELEPIMQLKWLDFEESFHDTDDDIQFEEDYTIKMGTERRG